MQKIIDALKDNGYLHNLDIQFAKTLCDIAKEDDLLVMLAVAAISKFTRQGNICVNLDIAEKEILDLLKKIQPEITFDIEKGLLKQTLKNSSLICHKSDDTPLVIDEEEHFYFQKYWNYQQRLINQLLDRTETEITNEIIKNDGQNRAVQCAIKQKLTIISGGPGTGKTFTVANILGSIIKKSVDNNKPMPVVFIVAPTGKAAARLKESIKNAKMATGNAALKFDKNIISKIPYDAKTIHRTLKMSMRNHSEFIYNAKNTLPIDVMIVDEASMINLALMTKLIEAIPVNAKLILIGDKDQLSPVDAGAVFGDLCALNDESNDKKQSSLTQSPSRQYSLIEQNIVELKYNYRFGKESGIGILASAINQGKTKEVTNLFLNSKFDDIKFINISSKEELEKHIEKLAQTKYLQYLSESKLEKRLLYFEKFRVLCAHNAGPFGVEAINKITEQALWNANVLNPKELFYCGRPLMITQNDYSLNLFNGDVGIISRLFQNGKKDGGKDGGKDSNQDSRIVAAFNNGEEIKTINPYRLSNIQTVYAMTVHKSQGSEFDDVFIVLPAKTSQIVTRELLYTAITRAKKSVTILGTTEVLKNAIKTKVIRTSGLKTGLSKIRAN